MGRHSLTFRQPAVYHADGRPVDRAVWRPGNNVGLEGWVGGLEASCRAQRETRVW